MAGLDRKANRNRDVLERIVVLLLALANLADLAADASFLRRRRVLGILSHGEAEARAFIIGVAIGTPVQLDFPESTGDAARLAASFRALAQVLFVLLTRSVLSGLPGAAGPRGGGQSCNIAGLADRQMMPPAHDTS